MVAQGRVAKAHWRALKGPVSAPVTDSARHSQTPPDAGREADAELYAKLLGETARVSWAEIERLFAAGHVLRVAAGLDLIAVAQAVARDDAAQLKQWMQGEQVGLLDDTHATRWASAEAPELWGVVVRPWVLVQERESAD